MKNWKLLLLAPFLFLACSPATKEGNSALEEERNSLRKEISSAKGEISSLQQQKASLTEEVAAKEKEFSIYKEGRAPVYIIKFEMTLRKNLDLRSYSAEFELPVSKEYYDAAQIGQDASEVSAYKTLTIAFVSADCEVTGKRIE